MFIVTRDNILNFGILCTQKNKKAGEKKTVSQEIRETIRMLGLQNYVNYERMNPIEITLDSNDIAEKLSNHRKLK